AHAALPRRAAVGAATVPLRHTTAGGGAEDDHTHRNVAIEKGPGSTPGPASATVPTWFRRCRRKRRLPSPAPRLRIRASSKSSLILPETVVVGRYQPLEFLADVVPGRAHRSPPSQPFCLQWIGAREPVPPSLT